MVITAGSFGETGAGIMGNVNTYGSVNVFDLVIVAGNFGQSAAAAALSMATKIKLSTEQRPHISHAIGQLEPNSKRMALNALKAVLPEKLPPKRNSCPTIPTHLIRKPGFLSN